MKKFWLIISSVSFLSVCKSQATFNAGGVYTQNFGTVAVGAGAWTNNTTFTGWYLDTPANFQGTINITAASPSNTGGQYMYTCSGGTDLKLGTRPSNGSGGGPCADAFASACGHGIGLRLVNNSGATINSLVVSFDWFQLSLAQNGSQSNTIFFGYQTGATVTSVTAGAWTSVSALDFSAPQSSAVCCSNQINGYPCTQTGNLSGCFVVTIPNNQEIMLRWWDPNNSNNDPHLAIDNVSVTAYSDVSCLIVLPLELTEFAGEPLSDKINLYWKTASEKDLDNFELQKSLDGINFFSVCDKQPSNNNYGAEYFCTDFSPSQNQNYYRLKISEKSGEINYSELIGVSMNPNNNSTHIYFDSDKLYVQLPGKNIDGTILKFCDIAGKCFFEKEIHAQNESFDVDGLNLSRGIYFATVVKNKTPIVTKKIVIP